MRAVVLAAALFAAAPAFAQPAAPAATRAVLADAARAPAARTTVIDGAAWRCEGSACIASGGANQPAARACRRFVARLGAVTEFSWKGQVLSSGQLAVCNA